MRLDQWLLQTGENRSAFARRANLSPASVTALCNDPNVWVSRDMARKIAVATDGAVTPNDFLGLTRTKEHPVSQTRVAEAIRAFERGEMVVVTDDDDRENEGDLIVAASKVTSEQMAFMVRHTSGIICAPMTVGACKPVAARSDGGGKRCATGNRLHHFGRLPPGPDNRASPPKSAVRPCTRWPIRMWPPTILSARATSFPWLPRKAA